MGSKPILLEPPPFSTSKCADTATEKCAVSGRKVVNLRWEEETKWCSETVRISGTTSNYGDGESIPIALTEQKDATVSMGSLGATVKGSKIANNWQVVDVLPERKGDGGYLPRRDVAGKAENARTPKPLQVRFVLNFGRYDARGHKVRYVRNEPAVAAQAAVAEIPGRPAEPEVPAKDGKPAIPAKPEVPAVPGKPAVAASPARTVYPEIGCNFEMELSNGLVTCYLNYAHKAAGQPSVRFARP
jgi:hypothetical protein